MRPFLEIFLAQWLGPSRSQYRMFNRCLLYLASLFAEISKSISWKLDGLHSVLQFSHWFRLILGKPPNILCFKSLYVKYLLVFCIGYLHSKFAGTSHDSLLFLFVLPMRHQVLGGEALQVEELQWKKWNYELCKEGNTGCLFLSLTLKSWFDLQVSLSVQSDTCLCWTLSDFVIII